MTINNNDAPEVPDEPVLERCDWCGDRVPEDDIMGVNDGTSVCSDCYDNSWRCEDCEWLTHNSSYAPSYDVLDHRGRRRTVCDACSENYEYCEDCERYISGGCEDCYGSGRVNSYSYHPSPMFFSPGSISHREPNEVVTGFELEVEVMGASYNDSAQIAQDIFGDLAYLKSDGSLDHGFEIVTHPFTLGYLREKMDILDSLKRLTDLGVRSANTRTCGLHVHINRGYFRRRETSLYRLLSLLYHNSTQWVAISGRNSTQWANWDRDNDTSRWVDYVKHLRSETSGWLNYEPRPARSNEDRYVAVNLQPRNTVELRFFKGTLNPETLRARLEGVHAAVLYSNHTRININAKKAWDWDKFRTFTQTEGFASFDALCSRKGV